MPLAEITFTELAISVVEVVLFAIWAGMLFIVLADLFRDHRMPGWGKALWIVFLLLVPYLSVLIYVATRSGVMRERALQTRSEARYQRHPHPVPPEAGPTHELHKLADLKEKGVLSAEEFDRVKAKILA